MGEQFQTTRNGLKWSIIDQVLRQIVTVFISAVLSRLLTPAEFGILAMITIALGFLQVIKDIGLGSSIIQKQGLTDDDKSTIFWVNVIFGFFLSLILVLVAPLIAHFFNESKLTILIRVMSISFMLSSLSVVPDALLIKSIDFKRFFFRNFGSVIMGGIVGILMAFYNFGIWSLIGQNIVISFTGIIISFRLIKWRPQFVFKEKLLITHLKFSLPLLGDSSINYWVRNIDNLLVAKFLGSSQLGIYNRAYSLMLLPVNQISSTLSRVMFPSFSLIQNDNVQIWDQYRKMVSVIGLISFPIMAILGVFANEVILLIYGTQWIGVVPIFQILCLLGAFQSIATLSGSIFYSKGKTFMMFKIGLISKSLMISGIILGMLLGGLMGMVWGYLIVSFFSFCFETYFVTQVVGKKISDYFKSFFPELLGSVAFLLVIGYSRYYSHFLENTKTENYFKYSVFLILGSVIYLIILKRSKSLGLNTIIKVIDDKRNGSSFDAR